MLLSFKEVSLDEKKGRMDILVFAIMRKNTRPFFSSRASDAVVDAT